MEGRLIWLFCDKCQQQFAAVMYPHWSAVDAAREIRQAHASCSHGCAAEWGVTHVRVSVQRSKAAEARVMARMP